MVKELYFEHLDTNVVISRRKGTKNLRITIKNDGKVKLSVPYGVSDRRAKQFLEDKSEWVAKHYKKSKIISDGQHIGKSHRLVVTNIDIDKPKTRISNNLITINLPFNVDTNSDVAQKAISKACERALKIEASKLLPQRLEFLSDKYQISYKSIKVKKLLSRWGSCDNRKNIVLNIYLMQLDWSLIDYVIMHELSHTVHQHHQKDFWEYLGNLLPDFKERRKLLKSKPTDISATSY
jgi:predicted metal-dependent hydrolase